MKKLHSTQSVTVVCCVEAGALEQMTVRMIASLRLFGGGLSSVQVLAVTPRRGPKLSDITQKAFQRYRVEHICIETSSSYSWNNFINKPQALLYAIKHCQSDVIVWLDSDIIVTDCLEPLALRNMNTIGTISQSIHYEFAACPVDKNVGTSGIYDKNDAFWQKVCSVLGLCYNTLPYVTTCSEGIAIKWYFNSGVFSFKRKSGFAELFNDYCHQLLQSNIASNVAGIFFTDQICMGLAVHSLSLKTKILKHKYNFAIGSHEKNPNVQVLKNAAIIHYHDALWAHEWPRTMLLLYKYCQSKYDFVNSFGELKPESNFVKKLTLKSLTMYRAWKLKHHLSNCKFY